MKIPVLQLANQLQKTLHPAYTIYGEEILLAEEARHAIIEAAKNHGFTSKTSYEINNHFSWEELLGSCQHLSLFSEKEIIDLRITSLKKLQENLESFLKQLPIADKTFIFSLPKLDSKMKKSRWFTQLEQQTLAVECWPITRAQLPNWLSSRLAAKKLSIDQTALTYFAEIMEGNLLAAKQLIEKLALLFPHSRITKEQLLEVASENSQFELYSLLDDILVGDIHRVTKTLDYLKTSGTEPILLLWLLSKELRIYYRLMIAASQQENLNAVYQALQIWPKRQPLYRNLANKFTEQDIQGYLLKAPQIDAMIKGAVPGNYWDELVNLTISMTGKK